MKKKKKIPMLPNVSSDEVKHTFPKTEAILLRLSVQDKKTITEAAGSLHLTATEYLLRSALTIAAKLPKG